jgi:Ser/Thr protein kinase RdoA (MazF antagonist)
LTAAAVLEAGWGIAGARLEPLGDGHINDTLLATAPDGARWVLQRINEQVFTDPARVMRNLARVETHLGKVAPGLIPPLIETREGRNFCLDEQGGWWRLWDYLPDGHTIEQTRDPAVCRAAAQAFGRFQRLLSDLPGPPLAPTIPGFLELDGYLARFDAAVASTAGAGEAVADACGNASFIDRHRDLVEALPRGRDRIHGDCKLNNLLFDASGRAVRAILDLDTTMLGHWAWDFGDLARSVLTGVLGDEGLAEQDAQAIARALFVALVDGLLSGSERALDARSLAIAPGYVAFMLGVRFLTDHLEGDRYFKVSERGENLDRARRQFALLARLPVSDFEAAAGEVLGRVPGD